PRRAGRAAGGGAGAAGAVDPRPRRPGVAAGHRDRPGAGDGCAWRAVCGGPPSPRSGPSPSHERTVVLFFRAMGKGERTRQAVLQEATEIAARHGLSGLTIGTLASSAGMSKSGLYAHFGSKEALQLAIL